MPDGAGFALDLEEMEKVFGPPDCPFPAAIALSRAPVPVLRSAERLTGPFPTPAARRAEEVYLTLCETMADLHGKACDAMDANAQALREVIELYRRVDGRI